MSNWSGKKDKAGQGAPEMRAPTAVEPDLSSPEATLGQRRVKTRTHSLKRLGIKSMS